MSSPPLNPLRPTALAALAALAALPAGVLAAVQIAWCWPFFSDDSFISLRYSERLLAGDGLTWTDGEAVEGYSNLLWVLLCAALGGLGMDLVFAARLVGILATGLTLWWLARLSRPHDLGTAGLAALAPLLVAGTPQIMSWTAGGLEGPAVMLLLTIGLASVASLRERVLATEPWPLRGLVGASVPFALLVITRPDGPLWAAAVGAGLVVTGAHAGVAVSLRRLVLFGALPAACCAGQIMFRWLYYGDWVPNTAHVKVDLGSSPWAAGIEYVVDGLRTMPGLAVLGLLATLMLLGRRGGRLALPILLCPLGLWLLYLASVGGDHFAGYRLMQPALAPLALLVALAARDLTRVALRGLLVVLAVTGAGLNVVTSRSDPLCAHNRTEMWEWQGKVIGEVLAAAFSARAPMIAVDAAGSVPYYSGLPALDMLGLNDRTIARTATPDWAEVAAERGGLARKQGHMRGNGSYVLDRAPDLVQFSTPPGLPLPVFLSGLEMEGDPRFLDGYRLVMLEVQTRPWAYGLSGPITSFFWVRVEGRAGVTVAAAAGGDRVEIPGYLFGAYRLRAPIMERMTPFTPERYAATGRLAAWADEERTFRVGPAADGALVLHQRARQPLALELPTPLPAGRWTVAIEPAAPGATGAVMGDRVEIVPGDGTPLPWTVRRVVLTRSP